MRIHTIDLPDLKANYNVIANVLAEYKVLKFQLGAEIGVRHGDFSQHLMQLNPDLTMYLIDSYPPYMDVDHYYTEEEQAEIKSKAHAKLESFGEKAIWFYLNSVEAAALCPDHMLDFVFIDAEHTYDSARKDIQAWHSKVKLGGLFCGHDFDMDGVNKAVKEFAADLARDIYHVSYPSDVWYMFL